MENSKSNTAAFFRVGVFTLIGLALIGAMTVFVNDKPYWWRACQLVHVKVSDASGLKSKSPVKSLGLEIGYLKTVELSETYVRVGVCITAPVEILPTTRAYIQGDGFLGDKFLELKPVRYKGPTLPEEDKKEGGSKSDILIKSIEKISSLFLSPVFATEKESSQAQGEDSKSQREIPIGEKSQDLKHVIEQVDNLVGEMTSLTNNLKEAINPQELRQTMQQLNKTLENASKTFAPEGGLNTTAQRTLAKLEDAIEQLRDQFTRINKGEGSVGMLLNDPSYAKEIKEAMQNINRLLSKVGGVRFIVDVGAERINAFGGTRGWYKMRIFSKPDRYYLLGLSVDPRGKRSVTTTTTTTGGISTTTQTIQIEQSGILFTAMLGKVFLNRMDLSLGLLHSDGAISMALWLGPNEKEQMIIIRNDVYSRGGQGSGIDDRIGLFLRPLYGSPVFSSLYLMGGLDSIQKVDGKLAFSVGAGLTFDDDDIKLLFALR